MSQPHLIEEMLIDLGFLVQDNVSNDLTKAKDSSFMSNQKIHANVIGTYFNFPWIY
jgi:hypothetical protein